MELYKYINNEALDEDTKAKRVVVERLRRQIQDVNENYIKLRLLEPDEKVAFGKLLLSFNSSIDQLLYGEERLGDLGEMPYKYNLISFFLKKLPLTDIDEIDKQKIYEEMAKFVPKLGKLEEYADTNGLQDSFMIPLIKDNIINQTFNSLTDLPENYDNTVNKARRRAGRPTLALKKDAPAAELDVLEAPQPPNFETPATKAKKRQEKTAPKTAEQAPSTRKGRRSKAAQSLITPGDNIDDIEQEPEQQPATRGRKAKAAAKKKEIAEAAAAAAEAAAADMPDESQEGYDALFNQEGSGKKSLAMNSIVISKSIPFEEAKSFAKKILKVAPKKVLEKGKTWHFMKSAVDAAGKEHAVKINKFVKVFYGIK